jgi:N-acetylglucosaminyl-diphospho-decaprenol L-rhamnosyltransferase
VRRMASAVAPNSRSSQYHVSVCILSYNTADLLPMCLDSVIRHVLPLGAEIIVVDNASGDGSAALVREKYPQATLITNTVNRFFTGGVNQAAAAARGEFLLFLNSDAYLFDDSVRALLGFLESHPECAAAEGLTLDAATGAPRLTARRFCSMRGELVRFALLARPFRNTSFYSRLRYRDQDPFGTWPAEVACNCFMLMRRRAFEIIGGADESLLLYYSEDDWARELQRHGFTEYHVGTARAFHLERGSTDRAPSVWVEALYLHDRFAYLRKHEGLVQALLTTGAVLLRRNLVRAAQAVWTWRRRLPRRVPEAATAGNGLERRSLVTR